MLLSWSFPFLSWSGECFSPMHLHSWGLPIHEGKEGWWWLHHPHQQVKFEITRVSLFCGKKYPFLLIYHWRFYSIITLIRHTIIGNCDRFYLSLSCLFKRQIAKHPKRAKTLDGNKYSHCIVTLRYTSSIDCNCNWIGLLYCYWRCPYHVLKGGRMGRPVIRFLFGLCHY